MNETARERYIITGHDQIRRNKVVHFRRRLEEGQNTLEDLAVADTERDAAAAEANAAAPPGSPARAPTTADLTTEQNLIGPRDERVQTTGEIIPDGTVIVMVKGWEIETETPTPVTKSRSKKKE